LFPTANLRIAVRGHPIILLFASISALAFCAAGCALVDPTEYTFDLRVVNNTSHAATVRWCDARACTSPGWTDRVAAHSTSSDGVNNSSGGPLVFSVNHANGRAGCIRLDFGTRHISGATIRLSEATAAACRGAYG
jgi:hypothetical protein